MDSSIIGFFAKIGFQTRLAGKSGNELFDSFQPYIWGENGIKKLCEPLLASKYGNEIDLILFECHLKPSRPELKIFKDKISIRKNEKSIGISIILDDDNFFKHPTKVKNSILKKIIFEKVDYLDEIVKSKKINFDISRLKADLSNAFHFN